MLLRPTCYPIRRAKVDLPLPALPRMMKRCSEFCIDAPVRCDQGLRLAIASQVTVLQYRAKAAYSPTSALEKFFGDSALSNNGAQSAATYRVVVWHRNSCCSGGIAALHDYVAAAAANLGEAVSSQNFAYIATA